MVLGVTKVAGGCGLKFGGGGSAVERRAISSIRR
jgi:hypothetical protein